MTLQNNLDILMIDACDSTYVGVEMYLKNKIQVNMQHLDNLDNFHSYVSSLNKYDLFIIDVSYVRYEVEAINSYDIIYTIRKLNPRAKIIVYTLSAGVWHIKRLSTFKINGVVHKSDSLKNLYEAIIKVLQGEVYVCRKFRLLSTPNNSFNPDSYLLDVSLNTMENLIIRSAALGMTSREIAEKYNRSINTILDYRKKLFIQFNVNSMEKLLIKALKNGFPLRPERSLTAQELRV